MDFIRVQLLCFMLGVYFLAGYLCENSTDFCADSPCVNNATCVNGSESYICECARGWKGRNCTDVYDTCVEETPCGNGTCNSTDLPPGEHKCHCPSTHAGVNCSVALDACQAWPCQNGAVCKDSYDENLEVATFSCACAASWTGRTCENTTEMAFVGKGSVSASTQFFVTSLTRIAFDLKTTYLQGSVLTLSSSNNLSLVLRFSDDRLFLDPGVTSSVTSAPLENFESSTNASDPRWNPVVVSLDPGTDSVSVEFNGTNASSTIILTASIDVNITSTPIELTLSSDATPFAGCVRDLRFGANAEALTRSDFSAGAAVVEGCRRNPQCVGDPCNNGGKCVDRWNDLMCRCARTFAGANCSVEVTPVTLLFNKEPSSNASYVFFNLSSSTSSSSSSSISLLFKTKATDGLLFFLGSATPTADSGFLAGYLKNGVVVAGVFDATNGSVVTASSDAKYNDGNKHQTDVSYDGQELRLDMTTTSATSTAKTTTTSVVGFNVAKDAIFIGGVARNARRRRALSTKADVLGIPDFKGVLQDPLLDSRRLPLTTQSGVTSGFPGVHPEPSSADVVEAGIKTDQICENQKPCVKGNCENVEFQNFKCVCPPGFDGKTCEKRVPCQLSPCASDATCRGVDTDDNLVNGFEGYDCVAVSSFKAGNEKLIWTTPSDAIGAERGFQLSFDLRTRSKDVGLFQVNSSDVSVEIRITSSGNLEALVAGVVFLTTSFDVADAECRRFHVNATSLRIYDLHCANWTETSASRAEVGGAQTGPSMNVSGVRVAVNEEGAFSGCLRDVRLFSVMLPLNLYNSSVSNRQKIDFTLESTPASPQIGAACEGGDVCGNVSGANPCYHDRKCRDEFNKFVCDCGPAFNGTRCETTVDLCPAKNCVENNTAECYNKNKTDGTIDAFCKCNPGFQGDRCAAAVNPCDPVPCHHGGNCTDIGNGAFHCDCPQDYIGKDCSIPVPTKCDPKPCLNQGTCKTTAATTNSTDSNLRFSCSCPKGFEGVICQVETCAAPGACGAGEDSCVDNKWRNDAGNEIVVGHTCFCKPGWRGSKCSTDIDECHESPGICGTGKCLDKDGGFDCDCSYTGYTGPRCEHEINECDQNVCKHDSLCKNSPGSYECICKEGYEGNDCETADCDLIRCANGAECRVSRDEGSGDSSWFCDCAGVGQFYGGEKCEIKHVCHEDTNPCDKQHSDKCNSLNGTSDYVCSCLPGYKGKNCDTPIDYCLGNPCVHGKCINDPDNTRYSCQCDPGYTDQNCTVDIDDCAINPCLHNGTCRDAVNGYNCTCSAGWTGDRCHEDVDECADDSSCNVVADIGNNSCVNSDGGFRCHCGDQWGGDRCKVRNRCNETICKNGGVCTPIWEGAVGSLSGIHCNCTEGFKGFLCQVEIPTTKVTETEIEIIVGVCVAVVVIVLIIILVFCCRSAKTKRANRGTYSPSNQEIIGSRVEMGTMMMKPPPEERLI